MTLTTTPAARVPARGARKSPLRTATMPALAGAAPEPTAAEVLLAAGRGQDGPVTAPELRRMQTSEFAVWLRSRTTYQRLLSAIAHSAVHGLARMLAPVSPNEGRPGEACQPSTSTLGHWRQNWSSGH